MLKTIVLLDIFVGTNKASFFLHFFLYFLF